MRSLTIKSLSFLLMWCCLKVTSAGLNILFLNLQKSGLANAYDGILIDTSGTCRSFSFNGEGEPWHFVDYDPLPADMVAHICAISTPANRELGAGLLDEVRPIIDTIGETDITFYVGPEDNGILRLSAFVPDTANDRTREIICYQAGTTPACNSSPAAREIAALLYTIFDLGFSDGSWEQPPDSCLGRTMSISPAKPAIRLSRHRFSNSHFDLNGKRVKRAAPQVTVQNDGKRLLLK
jgi:hypothetical protein